MLPAARGCTQRVPGAVIIATPLGTARYRQHAAVTGQKESGSDVGAFGAN